MSLYRKALITAKGLRFPSVQACCELLRNSWGMKNRESSDNTGFKVSVLVCLPDGLVCFFVFHLIELVVFRDTSLYIL